MLHLTWPKAGIDRHPTKIAPPCLFCRESGHDQPASFVAAQSEDRGTTVSWVFICAHHADGWNDGGNWTAPVYSLTESD